MKLSTCAIVTTISKMAFLLHRSVTVSSITFSLILVSSLTIAISKAETISNSNETPAALATFQNPIHDGEWEDPYAYLHNDGFYYMADGNYNTIKKISIFRSKTLTNWRGAESILVYTIPDGYSNRGSAEVHYIDRQFYIYFSMFDLSPKYQFYVTKAVDPANPLGNWTAPVRLTEPGPDFSVWSGTVLSYGNGKLYFIWSDYDSLYISVMCDPMSRCGNRILLASRKQSWEETSIDEPHILQRFGRTFLGYSAYSRDNATSKLITSLGLMGIDDQKDPLISSNWWRLNYPVFWADETAAIKQISATSFTVSPDGAETWLLYHTYDNINYKRTSRAQRVLWNLTDNMPMPIFPRPAPLDSVLDKPSGEP